MCRPPFTLADLLALPEVPGKPPADRLAMYRSYLRYQLTRSGGVETGYIRDKRPVWIEKRAQGHLSPTAEKTLAFVAQRGRVTTRQIATELGIPRGSQRHIRELVDVGYAVRERGVSRDPDTLRITEKGIERAGVAPDTPVPDKAPPRSAPADTPDDAMVKCGGPCQATKEAREFYRYPNGKLRNQCKTCYRQAQDARRKVS